MQQQLKESLQLLRMLFKAELLGVYLFGSSVVGGLQKYSDIDLLVVTNRITTSEEKTQLIAHLLNISGIYMKSSKLPIEMTIVEKAMINPWRYPPHFDFQYGEWLRPSFEKGIIEPWVNSEMPDLALIITQVLLKSQTLWGLEPSQLLPHVPYHDFMKAMLQDLNRLGSDLIVDTRNVLLTYARIWSTLKTNAIRSKTAAADWVMNRLPKEYQPVIQRAKSICMGVEKEYWDDIEVLIKPCANFMDDKIHEQISLINFDDPNQLIKLSEDSLINKNDHLSHHEKGFLDRIRIVKCTHYAEWEAAKKLRQNYFFDPLSIADPYTWTFNHKEHTHFILYQGVEIIGYAHIQFWPDQSAALRIIVIDEPYRKRGLGSEFLHLCERWLKKQGIRSLHDEARRDAIKFYRKNGYTEMPFNDPNEAPTNTQDVAMGKIL